MSTNPILAKYHYRRRLPHIQKADADLFITFCTGGRVNLPEQARDLVLEHCLRDGGVLPFAGEGARATQPPVRIQLHAVVVMPDHVHILMKPLRDENGWPFPLVDILQCFKSTTAHRVNKLLGNSGPLWEEESFDHVLRSDEWLREKCEYIRQNPVEAGLVKIPDDYPWLWVSPELKNENLKVGGRVWGGLRPSRARAPAPHEHQKEKANHVSMTGLYLCRQRPTLPHTFACSTIGPAGLNFRVRDGNGWIPRGKITDNLMQLLATSS